MDIIVNDERDKVEENMSGYLDWLFNSIPSTQPSLETTTSVFSNNTMLVKTL